jgi:hypothetical protein
LRKLIASTFLSLDGVVTGAYAPDGDVLPGTLG